MAAGKTIAIILGGCAGAFILMLAVCGGFLYLGYRNVDANISPRVDALFSAIANGRTAETYETETTKELREVQTKENYVALGEKITEKLGALKTKSLIGFKVGTHNTDSYAEATYQATFEKGQATISVTMKQQDGQWKFVRFNVSSPNFKEEPQKVDTIDT